MIGFRIPKELAEQMRTDLLRQHSFASERVGFVYTKLTYTFGRNGTVVLAIDYEPVADEDYVDDRNVGARIGAPAIRRVMQRVLTTGEGAFHVHLHDHGGMPSPSYVDRTELPPMMRSIRNAAPKSAHGVLLLSRNAAYAEVLLPRRSLFRRADKISVVGFPTTFSVGSYSSRSEQDRSSRQSFLGPSAPRAISVCHVGVVGLGGGGSHIVQQLAHVGVSRFSLFDADTVESSNLNRLVGATRADVKSRTTKVDIVARVVKGVNPKAQIERVVSRWQDAPEKLRACDIIFGCVDSYAGRRDIEIATRRFLIPYIDIGLDVHRSGDEPPRMTGQVILSMPGCLCMSCVGFLTDAKLAREEEQYGAAGPRPQVVWANGVLASAAVGVAIDLITDWTQSLRGPVYLSYDSNTGVVEPHKRLQYLESVRCSHFPMSEIGDPAFKKL